jgi:hypothetical protein
MNKFFGQGEQLIRFVLLACGLLMLAGAVACLLMRNVYLAVACCVVSAWAIGYYLDTVWAGMLRAAQPQRHADQTDQEG